MPALPWMAIAAVATTVSAGVSTYKTLTAKPPTMPTIPGAAAADEAPAIDEHEAENAARQRQRMMRTVAARGLQSSTLKTGPAGLTGGAAVARKTLLGA